MTTEEAKSLMTVATRMAEKLGMVIEVTPEGTTKLKHLYAADDPRRKTKEQITTFQEFLTRNKQAILMAAGCMAQENRHDDFAKKDALAMLEWLKSVQAAADGIVTTKDGRTFPVHAACRRLLQAYKGTAVWLTEAVKFQMDVTEAIGWRENASGPIPEAWAS